MIKKFLLTTLVLLVLISSLILYSRYIGTKGLFVREYKITNENLTDNFHGFKVVHIGDLHYGSTFNKKDLKRLVEKINIIKPDIVVLTGDLMDKNYKLTKQDKADMIKYLEKIEAINGKYAIKGEEDNEDFEDIITNSNFTNLNDDYTTIYNHDSNYIFLAGLSSNTKSDIDPKIDKIDKYLNSLSKEDLPIYKILIMHEPDYIDDFDYTNYNLILAGHSHNGQIRIPFIGSLYNEKGAKKYNNEYYKIKSTDFYITGGLGTSTYNFRFLNHPSINFYRLTNK